MNWERKAVKLLKAIRKSPSLLSVHLSDNMIPEKHKLKMLKHLKCLKPPETMQPNANESKE
jgi:hypothetical protein